MPTGTVKWFNNAKGYGFILPTEGGEDLFVHYSVIEMNGYKTLKAGQAVRYETEQGTKGEHATSVFLEGAQAESEGSQPAQGQAQSQARSPEPASEVPPPAEKQARDSCASPRASPASSVEAPLHGSCVADAMLLATRED